jgi:phage tail sheath protein FI
VPSYTTPGVYAEEIFEAPPTELRTGVPAFLGYASAGPVAVAQRLVALAQLAPTLGRPPDFGYLADAVAGFFANGGRLCYVVRLREGESRVAAVREALAELEALSEIDLVCAPDVMRPIAREGQPSLPPDATEVRVMQNAIVAHCDGPPGGLGDRLAVLDSLPVAGASRGLRVDAVRAQRQGLAGTNGALYFPWVAVSSPRESDPFVPPCGHLAGIYARVDERVGVHKAPANEQLEDVLDLEHEVTHEESGELNGAGVNCLRAFPGRGIRVWGARTLAPPPWEYVSVRRLVLTAARWIERNLADAAFEPSEEVLWQRVERDVSAYLLGLFRRGALRGRTPEEAFFVKCDRETNPPEVREAGRTVTEIGLAPGLPNEFVVVHVVHSAAGVAVAGPLPA